MTEAERHTLEQETAAAVEGTCLIDTLCRVGAGIAVVIATAPAWIVSAMIERNNARALEPDSTTQTIIRHSIKIGGEIGRHLPGALMGAFVSDHLSKYAGNS